ncbi:leukocyte-associated immunoglobulin-like receptor 2 [Sturnira hondurensis]|uniref:leukocyte-associated immunoglobulin-like receptor 2 n=1 Tax=Sturnira hondurensis TaxID=192404 RepID=UPI001879652D|nr:leukocyte-associated immunoglobulin-like receptor 2 [Sturnira hondurensis]
MSPNPTTFLGLVLCLGRAIHTLEGALPKPSIWARPGPVIPRGQPVTIVCRGPAGADVIRLASRRSTFRDQKILSQHGSPWTEARFLIPAVSEDTVGRYCCYYWKRSSWSEHSEPLELKVADEDVSTSPSGKSQEFTFPVSTVIPPPTEVPLAPTEGGSQTAPMSQNYTVGNCVRIGLAGVVLLILVGILAEAGHSWHSWPHGPQGWTQGSSCQRD